MLLARQGSWRLPALRPRWRPTITLSLPRWQVVEELLSGNPHIEKESARTIADGAMMEAASVCVGQMVSPLLGGSRSPTRCLPCRLGHSLSLEGLTGQSTAVLLATVTGPGTEQCSDTLTAFLTHVETAGNPDPWRTVPGRAGWALGPIDQVYSLLGPWAAPGAVAGLVSVRHGLTLLINE